ncbi:MAG: hypothetical protein ACJAVK_000882 [Akkermansiaceae bacterium]|jgi:hypothetical protein
MTATVFRETALALSSALVEAAVDHAAFEVPLAICQLNKCRATCCHDGVILSKEEAQVLGQEGEGIIELPDGRFKTATVNAHSRKLADDFPAHFPKTRCLFLDHEHRCQWQLKAVEEGKHPWYYKPTSCWLHPLLLKRGSDRPVLTIVSREGDVAGFASFTSCGKAALGAPPAREALAMELKMLGEISGRDFYRELNAPPGFSSPANEMTSQ